MIVTGASSGIGLATCERLLQSGRAVVGLSRHRRNCGQLEASRGAAAFHWLSCDVGDPAAVREQCVEASALMGGVSGVVCAAGVGTFGSVEDTPPESARSQFDVNYFGVVHTLQSTLPLLRQNGGGRAVVIGSLASHASIPFQAHYSASKAALRSLVFAMANELHGTETSISLVEPGDIQTSFNDATVWIGPSPIYRARSRRVEQVVRQALLGAPSPDVVARQVDRVLSAKRPRLRYSVGPDRHVVAIGARAFPDRLISFLLRRHFDVHGTPVEEAT